MRREQKYIVKGALIGGIVTATVDVLLQWYDHWNRNEDFTWEKYNGWRTVKNSLVGTVLGAGVGKGYYLYKVSEEEKLPFSSDAYLKKLLIKEYLKSDPVTFKKIVDHREEVKDCLSQKFKNKLAAPPEDAGSFYKRTAIASNHDLDIILPFKKTAYRSLEDMYTKVYDTIDSEYDGKATVTKQTKAIGLTFENDGNSIHFDIVPGREINDYTSEKNLNLYVNPDWQWQNGSSFKTNVAVHKKATVNKPEVRKAIKLLKIYRDRNNLSIPTIVIERCAIKALSGKGTSSSETEGFLTSMHFLAKNLSQYNLVDLSNSNNNLHKKMGDEKYQIANQMFSDIEKIKANSRYIREIFEI
ncbi:MAG: hypothetical protein SFY32_06915 [Bacteroidota bacterium]|nr:hypothetical protein [Bacteroidota bacterium]